MRYFKILYTLVLLLFLIGTYIPVASAKNIKSNNEEFLIKFKDKIEPQLINKAGGKIKYKFKNNNVVLAELNTNSYNKLITDESIDYIEINAKIYGADQTVSWGANTLQVSHIHSSGFTGQGIKVAILDTGIDYNHEDINVQGGISFVPYTSDFMDDNNHGTHIAGIVAALDNNYGSIGVSPNVDLYSVKILDQFSSGTIDQLIKGIEWAIDNNINIINLSLTTYTKSKSLESISDIAYEQGLLIVNSAGNNGGYNKNTIEYPASFKSVIAVGALDENLERASFSSIGRELELMSPGVNIYSLLKNNKYGTLSGTSMSSAFTSGALALIWEANPTLNNVQIRELATSNAISLGDSYQYGNGLINASFIVAE